MLSAVTVTSLYEAPQPPRLLACQAIRATVCNMPHTSAYSANRNNKAPTAVAEQRAEGGKNPHRDRSAHPP